MSEPIMVGPRPCSECGGEYGQHDPRCSLPRPGVVESVRNYPGSGMSLTPEASVIATLTASLAACREQLAASEQVSEGRLVALNEKAEEARREWERAERAEANLTLASNAHAVLGRQVDEADARYNKVIRLAGARYTALHRAASAVSEAHQLIENEGEEGNLIHLVRALATLSALLTEPAGGSEEKPSGE